MSGQPVLTTVPIPADIRIELETLVVDDRICMNPPTPEGGL